MKAMMVFVVLGAFIAPIHAGESTLKGRWVLTAETQEQFAPNCRGMTLEFTADDRIVRTTGELTYTSTVVAIAEDAGWLLREELESQNGKPGCGGKSAEDVVSHFQHNAYVELDGSVLRYHSTRDAKRIIEFKRADAQQAHARDVRSARA